MLDARKDGPAFKSGIKGTTRDSYGRLVIGDVITAFKGVPIKCASLRMTVMIAHEDPQFVITAENRSSILLWGCCPVQFQLEPT